MKIIKRNGSEAVFDITKIITAVSKANDTVDEGNRMTPTQIQRIAESVVLSCEQLGRSPSVEEVQDMVEHQIMAHGAFEVAKAYITYRYTRTLVRQSNTTDDKILSLIECNNEEAKQENSNKNPVVNSTQRDYMAGEVSRDITNRILLPQDIVEAHNEGIIHFHDTDYYAQHMHNCDLVNLEDMLQNGTVITGTLIERPHSFSTACNIATQIVAQVASNQYGGQSISLTHLAPFVQVSREKIRRDLRREMEELGAEPSAAKFDEMVEKRLKEQQERAAREALVLGGNSFFRLLWDVACKKRALPPQPGEDTRGISEWPAPEVAERLKQILFARMADPESQEYDELWRMLSKGLPDVPHLPVQLLMAWEQVPAHYNFWYDRAGYAPGDDWWQPLAPAVEALQRAAREVELPACDLPFISIDSATTRDVDDAFHILPTDDGGFDLTLALACPAACWPFGEALDKAVFRRGTSIYLPEGDSHMMPEALGTDAFSLLAGQDRPAFCVRTRISAAGEILSCEPWAARVRLAANLTYDDTQAVLDALAAGEAPQADNPAAPWATMLACGNDFARVWQKARIARGAVIMDRPEPSIVLEGEGAQTRVSIEPGHETPDSQPLVAEMMILASAAVAQWAAEREIPMLHRTQDVALPREYAGIWKEPQDMTRIMRALIPSSLEVQARPHAALGLARYTPMTSPLRRYPDLINEAQLLHWLTHGTPRWDGEALSTLLVSLNAVLDAAGQVQRFRPRYWKLLYFRQQGDKVWWDGVVTEENDMFVNVSLPAQGMYVRGKRRMFDERTCPGMAVQVRIGRVHPLYNEIQILEAVSMDG